MDRSEIELFDSSQFSTRYADFVSKPSVFLSASEPYRRGDNPTPMNVHYVNTAQPRRILDAVSYLTRFVLETGRNLVFGGHPAISPMVLDIARRLLDRQEQRIAVFQSEFFVHKVPKETLQLADWDYGHLFWTPQRPTSGKAGRDQSLTWMRKEMLSIPNLKAGVFVGGMEGCLEEAEILSQKPDGPPCYAIASTGSAAADLLKAQTDLSNAGLQTFPNHDPKQFQGYNMKQTDLESLKSYPLLMKRIFADMAGKP